MKLNFLKTKEFKIKLVASIVLLILFSLSFLFADKIKPLLRLEQKYNINEVALKEIENADYKVNYLDVGQGNCTIVELPDDKILIIDGGSDMNGEKICNFLNDKGIKVIDFMIATHADTDHIGGLNYLFEEFEIVNIFRPMQIAGEMVEEYFSDGTTSSHFEVYEKEDLKHAYEEYGSGKFVEATSQRYRDFIKNIYEETYHHNGEIFNSEVVVFYDGLKLSGEGYELEFFAPLKTDNSIDFSEFSNTKGFMSKIYSADASNNSSAIFLLEILGDKFFFSGDASAPREVDDNISKFEESAFIESLTNEEKIKLEAIDVYMVAHHGSKYSSSLELLDLLKPSFAVVSVGKNTYGHPNDETIARLEVMNSLADDGLLLTQKHGMISFSNFEDKMVYGCEKSEKAEKLMIKYEILMIIFFVFLEIVIISVKPLSKKD